MNHLEDIRAKLNIEELVGSYIQLKKAGRNFKGLCPFHNDSRPSFMVSPEKGIAYCFSCNTGGDIFKFTQLIEKVEFPEAVRILAERTGVTLPSFKPDAQDQRRKILKINQEALDFFESQLRVYPEGFSYFLQRGLKDEMSIHSFSLGYAPDSYRALKDYLILKGYSEKELLEAGLLNQRSIADKNTYDRFRHRYIFPIFDHQNNVVGFGGRIIGEGEPKYLNSPDTIVYNKSYVLYGLNWAKEEIKKQDLVIVMEGYMDVITAHQAGTKNAVATSGTALTVAQLKLLSRYTKNIAFAFDQDSAGLEATRRAIELAQSEDLNISVILVPEGKDPDECIKNHPEKWLQSISSPLPVMDFYFSYALKHHSPETTEGRRAILALILPFIRQIAHAVEQDEYLSRLSILLKADVKFLWEDLRRISSRTVKSPYHPSSLHSNSDSDDNSNHSNLSSLKHFSREEYLLGFIFQYPQFYFLLAEHLIDYLPLEATTERFYKACKNVYNRLKSLELDALKSELTEEDKVKIDIYRLLIEEYYPDFSLTAAEKEILDLIKVINSANLRQVQKNYEIKIRSTTDKSEKNNLLSEYQEILKLSKQ